MSKIRVLIADDHQLIRDGLKMLINSQPDMEVIAEAGNGNEACELTAALNPDLLVTDVSMPQCTGVEVTGRLRQTHPQVRVLVLTVHEDREYLNQLVQAGASGYVLKRAAPDELARAIRAVSAGEYYLDPAVGGRMISERTAPESTAVASSPQLSERETEVARMLAWGYSNKEIAAKLKVSVKTVETHKARLQEKLNFSSRTQLVRYALRQGWLSESM